MPVHLAPYVAIATGKLIHEAMKRRNRVTCGICRTPIDGRHLQTRCCGTSLCSDDCLRAWQAAGGSRCIFHS